MKGSGTNQDRLSRFHSRLSERDTVDDTVDDTVTIPLRPARPESDVSMASTLELDLDPAEFPAGGTDDLTPASPLFAPLSEELWARIPIHVRKGDGALMRFLGTQSVMAWLRGAEEIEGSALRIEGDVWRDLVDVVSGLQSGSDLGTATALARAVELDEYPQES